jgi:hypothetical protein
VLRARLRPRNRLGRATLTGVAEPAPGVPVRSPIPARPGGLSKAQTDFSKLFGTYIAIGEKQKLFAFIDRQDLAGLNDCAYVYFTLDVFLPGIARDRSRALFPRLAEKIAGRSMDAALVLAVLIKSPGQAWCTRYRELGNSEKSSIDNAVNRQKAKLPRAQRAFIDAFLSYVKDPNTRFDKVVATLSTRNKPADLQACMRLYLELSQALEDRAGIRSLDVFYLVSDTALTTGRSTFALEYESRRADPHSLLHTRFEEMGQAGSQGRERQGRERQDKLNKKIAKVIEADAPPPGTRPGETKLPPLNQNQTRFVTLYRAYVDGGTEKQMAAFQNTLIKPKGDEIAGFVAVFLQDSAGRYRGTPSHRLSQIFFGTLSTAIAKSSSFYAVKVKSYAEAKDGLWRQHFDALNASQSNKVQYGAPLRKQIDEKIKNKRLLDDIAISFWLKYSRDPSPTELRAFDPVEPRPDFDAIDSALSAIDVAVGANSLESLDKAYSSVAAAIEATADPKARWVLVRRILERPGPSVRFQQLAYLQGVGLIYIACVKTYNTLYWNGFDQAERMFFFEIGEVHKNRYYLDFAAQVEGAIARRGERDAKARNAPPGPEKKNDDFYTVMAKAEAALFLCADRMNLRLTPPLTAAALRGCVEKAWDDHRQELEAIRITIDAKRAGKVKLKVGQTFGNVYILWWDKFNDTAYLQVKGYEKVVFEADPERLGKAYEDYQIFGKVAEWTEGMDLAISFMFEILGYLPDLVSGGITGLLKSILFNLEFELSMKAMGIDPTKAQIVLLGISLLHASMQPKAEEPHLGSTPEPAVTSQAKGPQKGEFFGQDIGYMPAPPAPRLQFYDIPLQSPHPTPVPAQMGGDFPSGSSPLLDQRMAGPMYAGTENKAIAPPIKDADRAWGGVYSQDTRVTPYESVGPFPEKFNAAMTGDWEPKPRSVAHISSGDEGASFGGQQITNASRGTKPRDFTAAEVDHLYEELYEPAHTYEPEGHGSGPVGEPRKAHSLGRSNEYYFNARSGSSARRRPEELIQESLSPEAVSTRQHAQEMVNSYQKMTGMQPPHAPGLDGGVPGSFYASHVELQQMHAHADPAHSVQLAVDKDMCGSCRRAVRGNAKATGREIVVLDPSHLRRFHSDGSVDIYPVNNPEQIIRIGKDQEPSVPANALAAEYEGNPW